jgi:signal transduction histidine kinase
VNVVIVAGCLAMVFVLALYLLVIRLQLRSINRQMEKRLTACTREPLHLELIHGDLNRLTANINRSFQAEEALRLEQLREEKRFKEWMANLSHDLRTPLTAIKGYQQLMAKSELTADQRHKLAVAQSHAADLGVLIEHFFEYAYELQAEPVLHLERLNLTNLVMDSLAASIELFEAKGLAVQVEENAPVFVYADQERLQRILHNLIRNCATYAVGTIGVRVAAGQTAAVVSFKNPVNSASGLEVDRLFERFYTTNRANSRTTGLGLAIVKLLTEQQGGAVAASLTAEGLLEIRVTLPIAAAVQAPG